MDRHEQPNKPILQFFKFGGSSFSGNYWTQSLLNNERTNDEDGNWP